MAELAGFNINHGFSEAVLRGLRCGFLGPEDYRRLSTSDSIDDMRSALEETDYGTFLQDEPSPVPVSTISKKCYDKLADEFRYVKAQSVEPLTTFLEYMSREKMIENVCMIIQGALNNKAPKELVDKLHPLGEFEGMKVIMSETFDVQGGFDEVYRIFLADTPIGPYFEKFLGDKMMDEKGQAGYETSQVGGILTKQDLEIMKATLKKAWLEDFNCFCQGLGGTTAETMGHMLKTEADFRVLLVTLNALNTDLMSETKVEDRVALYPSFGYLYPEGAQALRKAFNEASVRASLDGTPYLPLYDQVKQFYDSEQKSGDASKQQSIEDVIYKQYAQLYEMAFEQQYHFGVFYAWVKLREQEIRNIQWIANMVTLGTKDQIDTTIVPIFEPRM